MTGERRSHEVYSLYDDRFIVERNIWMRALEADRVLAGPTMRFDRDLRKDVIAAVSFDSGTPLLLMPVGGRSA